MVWLSWSHSNLDNYICSPSNPLLLMFQVAFFFPFLTRNFPWTHLSYVEMPPDLHKVLFSAATLSPHMPDQGLETHSVTDGAIMNSSKYVYKKGFSCILCVSQFFQEPYNGIKEIVEPYMQKRLWWSDSHYGQGKLTQAERSTPPLSCFQVPKILQWNPSTSTSSGSWRWHSHPSLTGFQGQMISNYFIRDAVYLVILPVRKPQKTRVPEGRDNRQLPQPQLFRRPSDAGTTLTGTWIQPSTERVGFASSGSRCRGRDSSVTGATGKPRIQSTVPAMSQGRLLEPVSDRPVLEHSGTSTPPKWLPVG